MPASSKAFQAEYLQAQAVGGGNQTVGEGVQTTGIKYGSADGRMVAGANADHSAYVWDVGVPSRPHLVARLGRERGVLASVGLHRSGLRLDRAGIEREVPQLVGRQVG